MTRKAFQKSGKCKICSKPLSDENIRIRLCDGCAAKELDKLKKRILVSGIAGAALSLVLVAAFCYARSTFFISDVSGYRGDVFIPTFFGHLALNARVFNNAMHLSIPARVLIVFACFCIPFSSFVQIDYKTHRRDAEAALYRLDSVTGNMAAGTNSQRMDDAGLFIMSLLLSAVSGPYFFVYRLYKFRQLSIHMGKLPSERAAK